MNEKFINDKLIITIKQLRIKYQSLYRNITIVSRRIIET